MGEGAGDPTRRPARQRRWACGLLLVVLGAPCGGLLTLRAWRYPKEVASARHPSGAVAALLLTKRLFEPPGPDDDVGIMLRVTEPDGARSFEAEVEPVGTYDLEMDLEIVELRWEGAQVLVRTRRVSRAFEVPAASLR